MTLGCVARIVRVLLVTAGVMIGADTGVSAGTSAAPDTAGIVRSAAPASASVRAPVRSAAARRLETTHIAGEIPVPQVLFITSRDQRRFMDFHHQRYLRTSRQLADATPIPSWMTVTRNTRAETLP